MQIPLLVLASPILLESMSTAHWVAIRESERLMSRFEFQRSVLEVLRQIVNGQEIAAHHRKDRDPRIQDCYKLWIQSATK